MVDVPQGWPSGAFWLLVCLCLSHLVTATATNQINDTHSTTLVYVATPESSNIQSQEHEFTNFNKTEEKQESPPISSDLRSLFTDHSVTDEFQTSDANAGINILSSTVTGSVVSILESQEVTSVYKTTASLIQTTESHTSLSPSSFEKQSSTVEVSHDSIYDNVTLEENDSDIVISIPTLGINESAILDDFRINSTLSNSSKTNDTSLQEDRPNFLTFEEWKKIKVSDKDGELAQHRKSSQQKKRPEMHPRMANNLDGPVGEEMEIEIEMFGGGGGSSSSENLTEKGKVYKDRFNYASFDCAATIVKTNSEAKGASAILSENKDTYLLNECQANNKHVIIELCEDILVDEVLIGNYEFFSSMFKTIRLSISDRFPVNSWTVLGEFKTENVRRLQTFKIENPLIWAKYLKLEVLSYYGDEFYCPLSSVQVHGKTMLEQFKEENPEDLIVEEVNDIDDSTKAIKCDKRSHETKIDESAEPNFPNPPDFDTFLKETIKLIETDIDSNASPNKDCLVSPYLGLNQFLEDYKKNINNDLCSPSGDTKFIEPKPKTTSATTQDSIYKNIIKRISLLESNATLSLLYIEEQSKLLSTAFDNLETRQNNKFNSLLLHLNITIQAQIDRLKTSGDELTGSFEKVFSTQNQKFQDLLIHSNLKLDKFENSLDFQKKINYLTLLIVFLLLLYIIVTRDTYIEPEFMNPMLPNLQYNIETPTSQSPPAQRFYNEDGSSYFSEDHSNLNSSPPKTPPITFRRKSRLVRSFLRATSGSSGSVNSYTYGTNTSIQNRGSSVADTSTGSLPIIVDEFETTSGGIADDFEFEVEKSDIDKSDTSSKLFIEDEEQVETPSDDEDELSSSHLQQDQQQQQQQQPVKSNDEMETHITSINIDEEAIN